MTLTRLLYVILLSLIIVIIGVSVLGVRVQGLTFTHGGEHGLHCTHKHTLLLSTGVTLTLNSSVFVPHTHKRLYHWAQSGSLWWLLSLHCRCHSPHHPLELCPAALHHLHLEDTEFQNSDSEKAKMSKAAHLYFVWHLEGDASPSSFALTITYRCSSGKELRSREIACRLMEGYSRQKPIPEPSNQDRCLQGHRTAALVKHRSPKHHECTMVNAPKNMVMHNIIKY